LAQNIVTLEIMLPELSFQYGFTLRYAIIDRFSIGITLRKSIAAFLIKLVSFFRGSFF
jgi:hypothetical protein